MLFNTWITVRYIFFRFLTRAYRTPNMPLLCFYLLTHTRYKFVGMIILFFFFCIYCLLICIMHFHRQEMAPGPLCVHQLQRPLPRRHLLRARRYVSIKYKADVSTHTPRALCEFVWRHFTHYIPNCKIRLHIHTRKMFYLDYYYLLQASLTASVTSTGASRPSARSATRPSPATASTR